jgi:CRISPR-associated endonuclease Cas1
MSDSAAAAATASVFARDSREQSVLVADGYGLALTVDRGHLLIRDGLGKHRRERRLPRAQRQVQRIIVLGHTGHVSLEAVRWCTDTGIGLLQIDTDGRLLLTAAAPGKDDPRLRRAQAAAPNAPVGLEITRALLGAKLAGQTTVAADILHAPPIADTITRLAEQLDAANTLAGCRDLEAQASNAYFGAWSAAVTCRFAERDRDRVPARWRVFSGRGSQLHRGGRSPRDAADPINALLNYGYALAEAECRLAAQAVGLDPGLGIVHTDQKNRDSLALDLLEPIRPIVERQVLQLLDRRHFTTADVHETRTGACRLLPPLTHELAEALPGYAAAVAPFAEAVVHALAGSSPGKIALTTPLSRANTVNAQTRGAGSAHRRHDDTPAPRRTCRSCGVELYGSARKLCPTCWPVARTEYMRQLGLARAKPREPKPTIEDVSGGYTLEQYQEQILPRLAAVSLPAIERATGLSNGNCSRLRRGLQIPNPRHWAALATLAGIQGPRQLTEAEA